MSLKRKRLGQNFFKRNGYLRGILSNLLLSNRHLKLVEIGPGKGALTHLISLHFPRKRVLLIEKDQRFALKFLNKGWRTLNLDFMDLRQEVLDQSLLISSLPYNQSKRILLKVALSKFNLGIFVIQLEVYRLLVGNSHLRWLFDPLVSFKSLKTLGQNSWEYPVKVKGKLFLMLPRQGNHIYRRFWCLYKDFCLLMWRNPLKKLKALDLRVHQISTKERLNLFLIFLRKGGGKP